MFLVQALGIDQAKRYFSSPEQDKIEGDLCDVVARPEIHQTGVADLAGQLLEGSGRGQDDGGCGHG